MADTQLASHHCEACEPGTPPLDEQQAAALTAELHPAWKREGNTKLRRTLRFEDFKDAFGFATRLHHAVGLHGDQGPANRRALGAAEAQSRQPDSQHLRGTR